MEQNGAREDGGDIRGLRNSSSSSSGGAAASRLTPYRCDTAAAMSRICCIVGSSDSSPQAQKLFLAISLSSLQMPNFGAFSVD